MLERARCVADKGNGGAGFDGVFDQRDRIPILGKIPEWPMAAGVKHGVEVRDTRVAVLAVNTFLAPFFWRDCAGIVPVQRGGWSQLVRTARIY